MASRIEDYALIGDTQTAALVGRDGSIDWLCVPRFDRGACFAALLGDSSHGRWSIAPRHGIPERTRRRYRQGTLVLETTLVSPDGKARVIDFMVPRNHSVDLVRIVAIERELLRDGLVLRYLPLGQDGLPQGEGVFLACSFWLADCYALWNRVDDARALYERLLSLRNDVGLLAEEYDPVAKRQLGTFPQAFSHVGFINTAFKLTPAQAKPAQRRFQ